MWHSLLIAFKGMWCQFWHAAIRHGFYIGIHKSCAQLSRCISSPRKCAVNQNVPKWLWYSSGFQILLHGGGVRGRATKDLCKVLVPPPCPSLAFLEPHPCLEFATDHQHGMWIMLCTCVADMDTRGRLSCKDFIACDTLQKPLICIDLALPLLLTQHSTNKTSAGPARNMIHASMPGLLIQSLRTYRRS